MSKIFTKSNIALFSTFAAAIFSTLTIFGIFPHSGQATEITGIIGAIASALILVFHAKPSTILEALTDFISDLDAALTPSEKTAIIQALSNLLTSNPVTTISNPTNTTTSVTTPAKKS